MASHASSHGSASTLPLAALLGAIPSFPRRVIERLVVRMIDHLDEQDGDAELEDATNAEDEGITFAAGQALCGDSPGCPVGDPGGCEHDGREPEHGQLPARYHGADQRIISLPALALPWNIEREGIIRTKCPTGTHIGAAGDRCAVCRVWLT